MPVCILAFWLASRLTSYFPPQPAYWFCVAWRRGRENMGYLTDICEGPLSFTLILRAPSRESNPVNKSFPVKSNPVNKVIPSQNADTTCENQKCPHPLDGPSTRAQNSWQELPVFHHRKGHTFSTARGQCLCDYGNKVLFTPSDEA